VNSYEDPALSYECDREVEIERLRARLAEAERDAARYRWLRARVEGEELERITNRWPCTAEECDAAIDAMLATDSA
jgi:hypothetical protein